MKSLLKLFLAIFTLLLLVPSSTPAAEYIVTKVIDGDTIIADYLCNSEQIRLLCVNTPESSVHPNTKQNIPMGKVASEYTKQRLEGKFIELEFEGDLRDRSNRLLAYVFLDGNNFNIELVKQGLSPYYTQYRKSLKYDSQFKEAEKYARDNKLGLWADPELTQKYLRLKSKCGQSAQ